MVDMLKNGTLTLESVQDMCDYAISLNLPLVNKLIDEMEQTKQQIPRPSTPCDSEMSQPNKSNHEDSESDFEMTPEPLPINGFQSQSPISFRSQYLTPSQDDESMEQEPSYSENIESMTQFSSSSLEEQAVNSDIMSPQMSSVCRNTTATYSATPQSTSSTGNVTLGFVMQRKVFDIEPSYTDKFWRMNETTFTFQSIRKAKKKNH